MSAPTWVLELLWRLWSRSTRSQSSPSAAPSLERYAEEAQSVRSFLRRFPYWRRGHIILAEISLLLNDVTTAYASAHAVMALSTPATRYQGQLLLGQCHLRRNDPAGALHYFATLQEADIATTKERDIFLEEKAAAHMALGDKEAARTLLAHIPAERRSPQAEAAWGYVGVANGSKEGSSYSE
jgi:hypothetical protein